MEQYLLSRTSFLSMTPPKTLYNPLSLNLKSKLILPKQASFTGHQHGVDDMQDKTDTGKLRASNGGKAAMMV